jgi:azurin
MRWILGTALVAAIAFSGQARAQDCAATIEANDAIQYVQKELTVSSSCESFSLTLKHIGSMPAVAMGHNWVLTKTGDYEATAMDGQAAGADNDYVKPDDARVIAHTKIIGGGEETTISFDASMLEPGGDYTFFCSFPAHYILMNGKLIVE